MARFIKTAITVPGEHFRRVERIRKRGRVSRSEVFAMALEALFSALDRKGLEDRYVRGYRKRPESSAELGPWVIRSVQGFEPEAW